MADAVAVLSQRQRAARKRMLWRAVLALRDADECERFFVDLCTPAEIEAMADRFTVARLLERGLPYRRVHDETLVSTATITRVARSLNQGEGGYRTVLDRLRGDDG